MVSSVWMWILTMDGSKHALKSNKLGTIRTSKEPTRIGLNPSQSPSSFTSSPPTQPNSSISQRSNESLKSHRHRHRHGRRRGRRQARPLPLLRRRRRCSLSLSLSSKFPQIPQISLHEPYHRNFVIKMAFSAVICTKAINLWRDYERKQEIAAAAAAAEMGESPPTPQELVGGGPAAAKS